MAKKEHKGVKLKFVKYGLKIKMRWSWNMAKTQYYKCLVDHPYIVSVLGSCSIPDTDKVI